MFKRLFDIVFSIIGLIFFSPLLLTASILIKIEDGGSIFYRGLRVGKKGIVFKIFKLRTMIEDAESLGPSSTKADDPRFTNIGKAIKKYNLDELPQFINVLKGEMSIVGPRPQVPWVVELYGEKERTLLSVLPGITDYATIKFRNEKEILRGSQDPDKDYVEKIAPEKLKLGLEYVKNHSLWVDFKIMFTTFKTHFLEPCLAGPKKK